MVETSVVVVQALRRRARPRRAEALGRVGVGRPKRSARQKHCGLFPHVPGRGSPEGDHHDHQGDDLRGATVERGPCVAGHPDGV